MRFTIQTVLCLTALLGAAAHAGTSLSLSTRGDFTPGAIGSAVNDDPTSTLTSGPATVTFQGATVNVVLSPGDSITVPVGQINAFSADPGSTDFTGAGLTLTMDLSDPASFPGIASVNSSLSGSVNAIGDMLVFNWQAPLENTFVTIDGAAQHITITLEPVTTVTSGLFAANVFATIALDNGAAVPYDVDGDGLVTITDALLALRIAGGLDTSSPAEITRADVNNDGALTLVDALQVIRQAAA